MPLLMYWKWIAAAVLAAVLTATHIQAWRVGSASTQAKWDAQIAEQTAATLKLVEGARERERELQEAAEKLRRAKNVQINQLATDLADALDRLRNRPTRTGEGSMPNDPGIGRGCYPSQLFAEDAGNLVKLAAEADKLRVSLAYCQEQYTKARDKLK